MVLKTANRANAKIHNRFWRRLSCRPQNSDPPASFASFAKAATPRRRLVRGWPLLPKLVRIRIDMGAAQALMMWAAQAADGGHQGQRASGLTRKKNGIMNTGHSGLFQVWSRKITACCAALLVYSRKTQGFSKLSKTRPPDRPPARITRNFRTI